MPFSNFILVFLTSFSLGWPSLFSTAQSALLADKEPVYIRVNTIGYLTADTKIAIAFTNFPIKGEFEGIDSLTQQVVFRGKLVPSRATGWGTFLNYFQLDFSEIKKPGYYFLKFKDNRSVTFRIGDDAYGDYQEDLLGFMRQQRCGYNPFLDRVCHQYDGRTMYGPMPDSTYIDVSGGWHDAGDQLKYLITSSNATARMLLAYELEPEKFADRVNALGQPQPSGIPDVLDEAKWGLDWIHKMHPQSGQLFHQVADDRDHKGWKWPDQDPSDYGWGPNSYRVVYFANGQSQGLQHYKSEATGIANLAGRCAAAMAIGFRIWQNVLHDTAYASQCLAAAVDLYAMGKAKEGYQQGNSYGAPYRYSEDTWADDMEWGAAELFASTKYPQYLNDAKVYAEEAATTSWMPLDTAEHYRYYPFVNVGHFVLYKHTDKSFKAKLAGYYRSGIEKTLARGNKNPYQIGVPFIWCSNNLTVALATQVLLYEQMTGDQQFHDFMLAQRDWLLGRNPWGTSMFTGIPRSGEYPHDVHTSIWYLAKKEVPGGLVDGPVYATIYISLKGLQLNKPDEFAPFQNNYVVYHDDNGDYATNEPTMDGTADAIFIVAHFAKDIHK